MIKIEQVDMVSDETIFTPELLEEVIDSGHNRIPVYHNNKKLIVGMLLVAELIRLNPHEKKSIEVLELIELPHVSSEMPLFHVLRQFKTGKSQMAIVLDAEDNLTPIGLITLEDVIETLIGDEIYDEIDFKKQQEASKRKKTDHSDPKYSSLPILRTTSDKTTKRSSRAHSVLNIPDDSSSSDHTPNKSSKRSSKAQSFIHIPGTKKSHKIIVPSSSSVALNRKVEKHHYTNTLVTPCMNSINNDENTPLLDENEKHSTK